MDSGLFAHRVGGRVLGFYGLEGTAMWIAKVLFLLFLILFVFSLIMGRRGPRLP